MKQPVKRILIISDRAEQRARLERLFQSNGSKHYCVTEAGRGQAGLDLIHDQLQSPFQCVLLREQLADMDAIDVLTQVNRASLDRACAVIMLTDANSAAAPHYLRAGAQDCLNTDDLTADCLYRSVDHAIEREVQMGQSQQDADTLRQNNAQFRMMVEGASEAIVILDQHGNIVLANAQTRKIFGYPDGELPGRHVETLMPVALRDPEDENVQRLFIEPVLPEAGSGLELTGVRKDGTEFPIEVCLGPLETSEGVLVSCVLRDITVRRRVEDELRKSDQQLRFIMDSMPPKIFTASPSGDVDYYNSQCTSFTGLSFEQLRGWGWVQFLHPDDANQHERAWRQALRAQVPFEIESRFRDQHGQYRWHFSRAVPMRGPLGQILMWIGSHTDIHDIKEAEEAMLVSEIRYRRLFEAAKDGILILDFTTGKIVDANPFMTTLLGYSHDAFVGCELWEIGLFGDRAASEAAVKTLQEKGYLRYEHLPLETSDGLRVEVEIVANAYSESDHQVIQCNVRDITERSLMERRLQDQAAELQDQHRRKDEFLAMLSHELRSPLAPIAHAVQLLSLQEGSESRVQQQARNIIERQLGKLQHLVDDLLEVSRITSGRVQLRQDWATAKSIVDGAVETVRSLIEQRRHQLTVVVPDQPLWLHGDSARLEQILVNLLVNAAKYTEEGGHIDLIVSRQANQCQFKVRDNGVGIADTLLPHVFDLFTQAERSLDRSQGGLGIGLALARRLTELHKGTIDVTSEPGKGSEFVVCLPLPHTETEDGPSPARKRTAANAPLKILVVDDTVDTAAAFSMLLRAYGHEVRTAHDGVAAIEANADFTPDVVILDIGLPGLDGYEVAKRIRQQPEGDKVTLIALTGYGQDSDREKSNKAGFNHHMVKPADCNQLLNILATVGHTAK